ncbi:hypothetical protein EYF80_013623 [Liparis tanakae]|uniref:Uncharacterized protein n=1 Tax=Liparis tanakae TaxID=230148 RepID=A0A4Z2IFL8_9TELE|nr:hypothetical protein EYF80_013623 [Liparis tanakae]
MDMTSMDQPRVPERGNWWHSSGIDWCDVVTEEQGSCSKSMAVCRMTRSSGAARLRSQFIAFQS